MKTEQELIKETYECDPTWSYSLGLEDEDGGEETLYTAEVYLLEEGCVVSLTVDGPHFTDSPIQEVCNKTDPRDQRMAAANLLDAGFNAGAFSEQDLSYWIDTGECRQYDVTE